MGGLPKDLQFSLIEPLRELFKVGSRFQPLEAASSGISLNIPGQ